jgi:hypothetical protein
MEKYFKKYMDEIIGTDQAFQSPHGDKRSFMQIVMTMDGFIYLSMNELLTSSDPL